MEREPRKTGEKFLREEFTNAKTFGQLFDALNRNQKMLEVWGINADQVYDLVERIIQKDEKKEEIKNADFETVPAELGIRDAVMRILIKLRAVAEETAA